MARSTRIRPYLAAAIAVLVTLLGAIPATAGAKSSAGFFGVTTTLTPTNTDLQLMGQARVGILRIPFGWSELQPIEGGPYNFTDLDRVVAGAASAGVRIEPFFFGTPAWARNCTGVPDFYCDRVSPLASPVGAAAWPPMLRAVVARYGTRGTFWSDPHDAYSPPYMPITEWQVWNEPNSPKYLRPSPTPRAYYDLLSVAAAAIRSADPSARIMLAGLYGTPPAGNDGMRGLSMWNFLDRLYRIKGAKGLFDDAALHPYANNVKGIVFQLIRGRAVMRKHHDRAGIYLTELGWASGVRGPAGNSPLLMGPSGQSRALARTFSWALSARKRFGLRRVDWFSWRDMAANTAANCVLCESFGLMDYNYGPKPALSAFARFTGGQP
jgi:polysaccharide biosynthesis protein PslG